MNSYPLTITTSPRRRTLAIQVREGQVLVRRPRGVSDGEVHRLLAHKAGWIAQKLAIQAARRARLPDYHFRAGEVFYFLGEPLELQVIEGTRTQALRRGGELQVTLSRRARRPAAELVREAVLQWLGTEAAAWFEPRAQALASSLGKSVSGCQFRITRSKWGHCTARGVLQFNPLIMQAPARVVHYLLVHEVCHLLHANHSAAYWQCVGRVMPDYADARRWLKSEGDRLFI